MKKKIEERGKYFTGDLASVDVRVVVIVEGLLCLFLGSEANESKLPTPAIPAQKQEAFQLRA